PVRDSINQGRNEMQSDKQPANPEQADLQSMGLLIQRVDDLTKEVHEIGQVVRNGRIEKEFYGTAELAELLSKSEYTVREKWCNQGRIECEKDQDTGKWKIPGSEAQRLLNGGGLKPKRK
ncbi:MAG: helix-turn-helix domain-containing protein, partial [Planctomycetales bacterium]